ncbi:MAG TPA: hypothetical protein PKD90_17860 [Phnomibacter sp.]|nr:hypothetical protein [Phnomibacter sp.]
MPSLRPRCPLGHPMQPTTRLHRGRLTHTPLTPHLHKASLLTTPANALAAND